MNLFLHGIGPDGGDRREPPITTDDALRDTPRALADVVVTNPPFGRKSSITVVNADGETGRQSLTYNRPDFWTTTSNKQLNFVQHVKSLLAIHGRAAVVVPDNVLFEGGAGETVRRNLLRECDVHTLLRLPTGIFYAQGVKANVLFFDRRPGAKEPWTRTVWVYDLRTNKRFTLKTRRMTRADLDEFVACYRPGARQSREATWSERTPDGRWRPYSYDEIVGARQGEPRPVLAARREPGGFRRPARAARPGPRDRRRPPLRPRPDGGDPGRSGARFAAALTLPAPGRGEGPLIRGWRRWRRRGWGRGWGRLRQRGYVPAEPCRIGGSGRGRYLLARRPVRPPVAHRAVAMAVASSKHASRSLRRVRVVLAWRSMLSGRSWSTRRRATATSCGIAYASISSQSLR